jgi:hypothetical protein
MGGVVKDGTPARTKPVTGHEKVWYEQQRGETPPGSTGMSKRMLRIKTNTPSARSRMSGAEVTAPGAVIWFSVFIVFQA